MEDDGGQRKGWLVIISVLLKVAILYPSFNLGEWRSVTSTLSYGIGWLHAFLYCIWHSFMHTSLVKGPCVYHQSKPQQFSTDISMEMVLLQDSCNPTTNPKPSFPFEDSLVYPARVHQFIHMHPTIVHMAYHVPDPGRRNLDNPCRWGKTQISW